MTPISENHQGLARRMLNEAEGYQAGANRLSESHGEDTGMSQVVLSTIALEILFKAIIVWHAQPLPRGHNFEKLWALIPSTARASILDKAQRRSSPHTDFSDLSRLFAAFKKSFISARYSYEEIVNSTEFEIEQRTTDWVDAGSPLENADFVFYPAEKRDLYEAAANRLAELQGGDPLYPSVV